MLRTKEQKNTKTPGLDCGSSGKLLDWRPRNAAALLGHNLWRSPNAADPIDHNPLGGPLTRRPPNALQPYPHYGCLRIYLLGGKTR